MREYLGAFVLALAAHAALLVLLVVNVDWSLKARPVAAPANVVQARTIDAARLEAEIQRREALERRQRLEAERKKRAEEERRRRKAEAERQRRLEARRKAAAERQRRLEAERKRKQEAERKRRKLEAERRKRAEAERRRQEEARKRREEERRRQEAERQRLEELQAALAEEEAMRRRAEEARRQAELERRLNTESARYQGLILEQLRRNWLRPATVPRGLECLLQIRLLPNGEVIDVRVIKGSGNEVFDRSAETAVYKASPLKVPSNPVLFNRDFRILNLYFNPED